jgi:hypothetical protein
MLRSIAAPALCALLISVAVSAAPPSTHYRSIGSAPDYATGTVTAVAGETHVIGSPAVQWQTANRGRGDRIDIAGVPYTILSVDAENELTLTEPYAGLTSFAEPYLIARKFKMLKEWEECIDGTTTILPNCEGVFSASLPTDERIEVGVVYKDSVYFMNTGGERLRLDNPFTAAGYTITLTTTPANRHHGVENTGVVLDGGLQSAPLIDIGTSFVTIEWIELHHGDATEQIFVGGVGPNSKIVVHNNLFHDDDNNTHGFHVNDDQANVLFYNNVLYGLNHGVHVNGLQTDSTGLFEFYHNTFYQSVIGLNSTRSTSAENDVIVMNGNLAHSNATADFNALQPNFGSSGNNWSGDGTGVPHYGVNNIPLGSIEFVSPSAPYDLHIRRTSVLVGQGGAIGTVPDDVDGRPRGSFDIGADEASSSSANSPKILTSTSTNGFVQLEWQHPDYGPMSHVEVVRSAAAVPQKPSDGTLSCTFPSPMPRSRGQCPDSNVVPPANGTQYFYSAFVYDFGGNYSKATSVAAIPFDTAVTPPEWTYATNAATLDPVGPRGDDAFVLSNDNFLHAMRGGVGSGAGEWPATNWAPYRLPTTVQQRPVIVDVLGVPTALLGGQDGRVYAVSTVTGRLVWKSEFLGPINAAPAALVGFYGATGVAADKVYVGTSDLIANSLHVLDLHTGARVERFDDIGNPENIGPITGVAVKYPTGPVFFTSGDGSGALNRNVWSIDVTVLPSPPVEIWSDNPGPIDSGPTLYNGLLLVGTRASRLYGYNDTGTAPLWNTPSYSDGPVNSPIFPVWPSDTVVFTTSTMINSVQVAATGGCAAPPCQNWNIPFPVGSASPPLVVPGTNQVFVGVGNGDLHEITVDLATAANIPGMRFFPISTSTLGGPAFRAGTLYISDSSGRIHGIPWPIP